MAKVGTTSAKPETAAEKAAKEKAKAADFARVASRRMTNALESIERLRALGNRNAYFYTPEQAAKMIKDLEAKVAEVKEAMSGNGAKRNRSLYKV